MGPINFKEKGNENRNFLLWWSISGGSNREDVCKMGVYSCKSIQKKENSRQNFHELQLTSKKPVKFNTVL